MRRFDGPHFRSTGCIQADNCNDLLGAQWANSFHDRRRSTALPYKIFRTKNAHDKNGRN
jgi:hypothetical protein